MAGDIYLERWELQGIFYNICAFYWSKDCNVSLTLLGKKYIGSEHLIEELVELGIMDIDDDFISISFLNEQWTSKETQKQVNIINGKKGGRPKKSDDKTRVYLLRCYDEKEQFLKIGVTTSTIASRYSSSIGGNATLPYKYDVLVDEVCETSLAISIEKAIKSSFRTYDPQIQFRGCVYECFDISNIAMQVLIKEAILNRNVLNLNPNGLELKTHSVNFAFDKKTHIEYNNSKVELEVNTEEDFAFTEKKSELINLICDKYGYAEMRFANKQRIVSAYVSTIIKSIEDYDYFLDNINCYVLYKQLSEEKQHGFDGLYGTQAERFEDGALQKENWRQKLVNHQLYQKPKSSFEKTNDVFAKLKEIKRQQRNGNTEVQPE